VWHWKPHVWCKIFGHNCYISRVVVNFVLNVPKFCHHGNKGRSFQNSNEDVGDRKCIQAENTSASKPLGLSGNIGEWGRAQSTLCATCLSTWKELKEGMQSYVKILRIRMTDDLESRGNRLSQVCLENGRENCVCVSNWNNQEIDSNVCTVDYF